MGRSRLPCRVMLGLVGDERNGVTFYVVVEGRSGSTALMGGDDVEMPWLRAVCSCQWKVRKHQRVTLEENAHALWLQHVAWAHAEG